MGILRTKFNIYIGRSPDPLSSRPNTKEEKRSGYARLALALALIVAAPFGLLKVIIAAAINR